MTDYRILGVARLTGLTPDTIRKWERRYRVVTPRRDERGIRRYTDADLQRLQDLRCATDLGYPIGEVARLTPQELSQLLRSKPLPTTAPAVRRKRHLPDVFTRAVLAGLARYDGEHVDRMLSAAAHLLPPSEFVFDLMSPLFAHIGRAWRSGSMEIGQEHLFSAVARSVLGNLIRTFPPRPDAPLAVFATPAGEPHEFGVLLAAMLAASEGLRVQYLGPNMPAASIVQTAEQVRAQALVLGVVRSRQRSSLSRSLASLAAVLPDRIELWLGGKAAQKDLISHPRRPITALPTLPDFYRHLRSRLSPS
jgi:DNA-binding transcriptional MerR regulator/methylmalonyl-CoA mutase cobalamin-binding subunit